MKETKPMPSQRELLQHFVYDPAIPSCLRSKPSTRLKNGRPLGFVSETCKAYRVNYGEGDWLAHRVVWAMHHGGTLEGMEVDHIDGDFLNNKIENLRLVTSSVNSRNRKTASHNTTGHKGISLYDNGRGNSYYVFEWTDTEGRSHRERWACKAFGQELAKELAIAYKAKIHANLLQQGYTERHIHG